MALFTLTLLKGGPWDSGRDPPGHMAGVLHAWAWASGWASMVPQSSSVATCRCEGAPRAAWTWLHKTGPSWEFTAIYLFLLRGRRIFLFLSPQALALLPTPACKALIILPLLDDLKLSGLLSWWALLSLSLSLGVRFKKWKRKAMLIENVIIGQ